jgi:DNA-binding transcriptional ArsR family regulator
MRRTLIALFAFSVVLLSLALNVVSSEGASPSAADPRNDIQTKVVVDGNGNVHVLWFVPALNSSSTLPGVWYSKFNPNGTGTISPTLIVNSTRVQSADMAVDSHGNAAVVWADGVGISTNSSTLYLLRFNSTASRRAQILTTEGSLIMWPSVALDNNDTCHLVWTQYFQNGERGIVEYGTVAGNIFSRIQSIATYNETRPFPPKARVIFDNSSGNVQVAWGESQFDRRPVSTVNYMKLVTNGTMLANLQVARFSETLHDVSIIPVLSGDGAYILWQTDAINDSVYVSQISSAGQLVYLKRLNYPDALTRYLTASTDLQGNLYVVSYQPSSFTLPRSQTDSATTVAYYRINSDGDIVQSGNQLVKGPIIAVTATTDGDLYAIYSGGFVRIVTSSQSGTGWLAVFAFLGCLAIAGTFSAEESRYKLFSFFSGLPSIRAQRHQRQQQEVARVLGRRPGLKLRELNRFTGKHRVSMFGMIRMERLGMIASFRDGLSRRFYVKQTGHNSFDPIATRVLLRIVECPGTWEAQLAKDLRLSQQLIHYHLKRLRDSKLITSTIDAEGSRKLYRFAGDASALHRLSQ